jgi:serine/threonine protein kinase
MILLVACKKVHSNNLRDVQNESEILSQLRHPNIIDYYGTYREANDLFLVMEYCQFASLDIFVDKRPLKLDEKRDM